MTLWRHRDRHMAALLKNSGCARDSDEAALARRLFRDMEELREFLGSMYGERMNVYPQRGTFHTPPMSRAVKVSEALKFLVDLGDLERDQLAPAAYLLELEIRVLTQSGHSIFHSILRRETSITQDFLRAFAPVDIAVLRENLPMVNWMEVGLCEWLLECRAAGIPRDYMQALIFALRVKVGREADDDWSKVPDFWPPETLHSLYLDDVWVQTIQKFWNQPEVLLAARADNLPWEYIDALADTDDRV